MGFVIASLVLGQIKIKIDCGLMGLYDCCRHGAFAKIGFYCPWVKIGRRMQTAQSVPVRYGPTSELTRSSEVYRRFQEEDEDDDRLPKGEKFTIQKP